MKTLLAFKKLDWKNSSAELSAQEVGVYKPLLCWRDFRVILVESLLAPGTFLLLSP